MIKFPYAEVSGRVIHVDDAEKGQEFVCVSCRQEMSLVNGDVRVRHFRHKADAEDCDPDCTLHKTAQALVAQGFKDAIEAEQEYMLTYLCNGCEKTAMHNAALPGATIKCEDESLIPEARPDLVIRDSDDYPIILEIVVTHDLEDETRSRYEESGIPVLSRKFKSPDDLKGLESTFAVHNTDASDDFLLNTEGLCAECIAADNDREEKRFENGKRFVDRAIELLERGPGTRPKFKKWSCRGLDSYDEKIWEEAKKLVALGFHQVEEEVFKLPINKNKGVSLVAEIIVARAPRIPDIPNSVLVFISLFRGNLEEDLRRYVNPGVLHGKDRVVFKDRLLPRTSILCRTSSIRKFSTESGRRMLQYVEDKVIPYLKSKGVGVVVGGIRFWPSSIPPRLGCTNSFSANNIGRYELIRLMTNRFRGG